MSGATDDNGTGGGGGTATAEAGQPQPQQSQQPQSSAQSSAAPSGVQRVVSRGHIRAYIKRSRTEKFLVVSMAEDEAEEKEAHNGGHSRDASDYYAAAQGEPKSNLKYGVAFLLVWIVSGPAAYFGYQYDYNNKLVYNNVAYSLLFFLVCNALLYLDYTQSFHAFQTRFENSFGGRGQLIYLCLFCALAFVDYVLIGLEEDGILPASLAMTVVIEFLFYTAIIFFMLTFVAYWKSFSFHCSEKAWIHALLYLTIVGGVIVFITRWIHPIARYPHLKDHKAKEQKQRANYSAASLTWNRYHDTADVLSALTGLLTVLFMFCVVLGGICINLFAEFASWSSQFGVGVSIGAFCVMSMVIMLTPLAPGSIVDACGGFVFVQVLVEYEKWDFFAAWAVALVSVILLHFCGACIQWWMGTFRCIQMWLNKSLPVEMLAASDAVLRVANWFEVGLVGYIFMDTANGLNQGRINMSFWTQLFSEWPSLPNGLGLVSFGATIAASALLLDGYDWTADAVPLMVLFSSAVQAIGFSFGTQRMAGSVDTKDYWSAREKWAMMHVFNALGYLPTQLGWENDCFRLKELFAKVHPLHIAYLAKRDSSTAAKVRLDYYKQYVEDLNNLREAHYNDYQERHLDRAIQDEWVVFQPIVPRPNGFFELYESEVDVNVEDESGFDGDKDDPEEDKNILPVWKMRLWVFCVLVLLVTFWASFYGFYWVSDLEATVSDGLDELNRNVTWGSWLAFSIFIADYVFMFHIEMWINLKSMTRSLGWIFCGCQIQSEIETKFETIAWEPEDEEQAEEDEY